MSSVAIILPFRDRGTDPLRQANFKRVHDHYSGAGFLIIIADDGREGDQQFCRSAAYNRGTAATDAQVIAYIEADTIISYQQLYEAVDLAAAKPGLVIPFTFQKKLSATDSLLVCAGLKQPQDCTPEPHPYGENSNYGCVNVLSRQTLDAVGQWDETFDGHGHDDNAMFHAFKMCAGPPRWVHGPAYHLYHLDFDPDTAPDQSYLSEEDKAAQARNYRRLVLYRNAKTADEIRRLATGYKPDSRWGPKDWRHRWIGVAP